jgi:O-acetyl-ADP-ribose deacetylase (regulator of RNase III)
MKAIKTERLDITISPKGMIDYIDGDLIKLSKEGIFDVIVHGCNCLSTMGAGIAPQMAAAFGCDKFEMESWGPSIEKLGNIDYETFVLGKENIFSLEHGAYNHDNEPELVVVNAYTQYKYGRNHSDGVAQPFDYEAFTICMRKINNVFRGKTIGMPKIGAGLAGGDWSRIEQIIKVELKDCEVIIINYKP